MRLAAAGTASALVRPDGRDLAIRVDDDGVNHLQLGGLVDHDPKPGGCASGPLVELTNLDLKVLGVQKVLPGLCEHGILAASLEVPILEMHVVRQHGRDRVDVFRFVGLEEGGENFGWLQGAGCLS